jgi:Glycosyl transferase family 11.
MIYLEMHGRLGNQFFRYAAARALQIKYYKNEKLVINFQQINDMNKKDKSFYNVLDDFDVWDYEIYEKGGKVIFNETDFTQKMICAMYYMGMRRYSPEEMNAQLLYEKKWLKKLNKYGLYWLRTGYYELERSAHKNKFLSGNFESPEYFDFIRERLLKEFTPKYPLQEKNKELYFLIKGTNSICLSVRRGDFENNEKIKKTHSVCQKAYFEKAVQIIREKIPNPVFFMFSDDIEWVRKNIKIDQETYYEDGTDSVWEKLRLMSACKHFIISNSTFSWWVQYLSCNTNKIVVSPNRWFNNDYDSPLINKKWILIDV